MYEKLFKIYTKKFGKNLYKKNLYEKLFKIYAKKFGKSLYKKILCKKLLKIYIKKIYDKKFVQKSSNIYKKIKFV